MTAKINAIRFGERSVLLGRLLGLQSSSEAETRESLENDAGRVFSTVLAHAICKLREDASTGNVKNATSVVSFEY